MKSQNEDNVNLILTLLNNVDELISISNDRQSSSKVLEAIIIFSEENGVEIPKSHILNLKKNLVDYPTSKINSIIKQISKTIVSNNFRKNV